MEKQQVACVEGCLWASELVFHSGDRGKDWLGEGRRRETLGRLSWRRAYPQTPTLELHTPSELQVYQPNIRAQKDFRGKPSRQDFRKD